MSVSDCLVLAEEWIDRAIEEADAAEVVIGVDQVEALRRLYRASRIAMKAQEVARRADFACEQNERSMS